MKSASPSLERRFANGNKNGNRNENSRAQCMTGLLQNIVPNNSESIHSKLVHQSISVLLDEAPDENIQLTAKYLKS
ncbi:hypothetical protein [Burkholderia sp. YIM B11467]